MKQTLTCVVGMFLGSLLVFSTALAAPTSVDLPHPKGVTVHLDFPDGGVTEYVTETVEAAQVYVLQFPFLPPNTYVSVVADISIPDGEGSFLLTRSAEIDFIDRTLITARPFSMNSSNYYRVQYDNGYLFFTIRGSAPQDLDGDGVMDNVDDCLGTVEGDEVDQFGCSAKQNMQGILDLYTQLPIDGDRVYGDSAMNGPYVNARMTATLYGVLGGGYWENQKTRWVTISYGQGFNFQSDKKGGVVCHQYQASVLSWLDSIRSSNTLMEGTKTTRKYKDLLSNVDYGPLEGWGFMHKAAAIHPRGSSWAYGWVLDPWFYQKAHYYDPAAWLLIAFPAGPDSNAEYKFRFPITGSDPGTYDLPDYVKAFEAWKQKVAEKAWNFFLGCPVAPCITDLSNGYRLGYCADGQFVNDIENASLGGHPLGGNENDKVWSSFLPPGRYKVEFVGIDTASFELQVAPQSGGMFDYGMNPITIGGEARFDLTLDQPPGLLTLPNGSKVAPRYYNPFGTPMTWLPILLSDD